MRVFKSGQKGYNLVEVLVAMAILGAVLVSVVALFYVGRRNIYSGKQLTFANSVGVQVLEDLSGLTTTALYAAFNIGSTTTLGSVGPINGITYPSSILRSSASISSATEQNPPGFLTRWNTTLTTGNRLQSPVLQVILTPTLPVAVMTATTPPAPAPSILRIRVVISWQEGQRTRYVTYDTIKTQRN